ncbi:MAG: DNA modification methylase [Bacillota bacterium]|nr:DNA modification methylase [Bacillota bacterium]
MLRLNGICPYFSMFPLDFPLAHLSQAGFGEWVLDPFCGRGTTNYAARLLGLPSVGVDRCRVAVAIAAAKVVQVTPEEVTALCARILQAGAEPADVPTGPFWDLCYHPATLLEICKVREALLRECITEPQVALRGIMLGALHGPLQKTGAAYLSNQMPRTYATKPNSAVNFWLKRGLKPPRVSLLEVVSRRTHRFFATIPPRTPGWIMEDDSRSLDDHVFPERFRWVVTSPPYMGMRNYVPDQWLRNWYLGGPPSVDYSYEGQIGQLSGDAFATALAEVWRAVSRLCAPGARLVVRFGCIPSARYSGAEVLTRTLVLADCGWAIREVRSAGPSTRGKRQAEQFGRAGTALEEVDLVAQLEA